MLIPALPAQKNQIAKANCAGRGCAYREGCRRFRVRIGEEWKQGTGQWISADVERELLGECVHFVKWHGGNA